MTEEIDLREILKLIIGNKKVIIAGTVICAILAGAVSLIIPPSYQSSLILEVGRIYLSPLAWTQEMEFLDDPEAAANLISSIGILSEVNRALNLGLSPRKIQKRLEVITFIEASKFLPILEVEYEGKSPRETVDVLNALAGIIVKRHEERYLPYQIGLEKRIRANRDKISAIDKIIAAQARYRELSQKYIDQGEVSAEEFSREFGELDSSGSTAVDMLYLQAAALSEKLNISTLTKFKAEMDMQIGEGRKEIADAEMDIADLQSRRGLSFMTRIVSPAIPIDKPVKPNRPLIVIIAAIIGAALMILIVTGREYLK